MRPIVTILLLVLSLAIYITTGPIVAIRGAVNAGSIDSWLHRAKDAGNPQQVAEFLRSYDKALDEASYFAPDMNYCIFRYPGCDMARYRRVLQGLEGRAEALATQAPTEPAYQMGLLNLEKDLGDLGTAAWGVWVAHWGWLKLVWAGSGWLLVIALQVAWALLWDSLPRLARLAASR